MDLHYDVVVIGSGPGGEGAAMKAVKEGKRVAMIEEHAEVGGNCTHRGTIPSKSLRQVVESHLYDPGHGHERYPRLLGSARMVIDQQVRMRHSFYSRNGVDILQGRAGFLDEHSVEVSNRGHSRGRVTADHFVIATGSRPYRPENIDFSHPRILDSDTILNLEDTPRSLIIYGAGVIGCEYASIFREMGVKVNLVNSRSRLLSYLDDEIIDALAYHLRERGVVIRHDEAYERVEIDDQGVSLHTQSNKKINGEFLLWAQGRVGNAGDMGLEKLGIEVTDRGTIPVNDCYQTSCPHIYAVGDVVGYPNLASAAYDQGRFAATHLVFGECDTRLIEDMPTGIYTIPEVSCIGATERELTERKIPYEVGRSMFRHLARAQILGQTSGMLKILFHRETLEILGIHCFGVQASEIIHIGQVVMSQTGEANSLKYFVNTTFNYPTMAEAYRVAALNGLNRIN